MAVLEVLAIVALGKFSRVSLYVLPIIVAQVVAGVLCDRAVVPTRPFAPWSIPTVNSAAMGVAWACLFTVWTCLTATTRFGR